MKVNKLIPISIVIILILICFIVLQFTIDKKVKITDTTTQEAITEIELDEPLLTEETTITDTTEDSKNTKSIKSINNRLQDYFAQMHIFNRTSNFCYSPISLNSALQLYSHLIEDKEAKEEIYTFIDYKDYLSYRGLEDTYTISNRIWVNKNKNLNMPEEVQEYVYSMDMTDTLLATKEKNEWVSSVTQGFIPTTPTVFTNDTLVDVMNIVYFRDTWADGDLDVENRTTAFKNLDDSTKDVYMLVTIKDGYFENDTCWVVPLQYENGMTLYLVKPKEDIEHVNLDGLLDNYVNNEVIIHFPEFEVNSEFKPSDTLDSLGLTGLANSKKIYIDEDVETEITQVTRIKVDKEGTEAAAVTEIMDSVSSALPITEPLDLVFDSEFVYFIKDVNNDIAFIGQIYTLE